MVSLRLKRLVAVAPMLLQPNCDGLAAIRDRNY